MKKRHEQIEKAIFTKIVEGALHPGEPIDEVELRERFGTSSGPVREALIRLETMGIVERPPRKGVLIARLSLDQLLQLVETQAEIEGIAASLAANRLSEKHRQDIIQATKACSDFDTENHNCFDYYHLNVAFHQAIGRAANNDELFRLIRLNGTRLISYFRARHTLRGQISVSARQHEEIAERILSGDGDGAKKLVIEHVRISDKTALDVLAAMNQ